MLQDERLQPNFKTTKAPISTEARQQGHPPQQSTVSAKRKQPPQHPDWIAKQAMGIGCLLNHVGKNATNYAFCSFEQMKCCLTEKFYPHWLANG